jgi:hypothetical protein
MVVLSARAGSAPAVATPNRVPPQPRRRLQAAVSYLLVGAVAVWNLIQLYPTTRVVAYLNDSAMHEQMVRFATASLRAGEAPATRWYPYLTEGSPQFLHYQQLGALLAGAIGTVVGATATFHWSTYLLVALWPVAIYASGRILGLPQLAAAIAAACSPFLVSVPGVGYEQKAYLWVGFGMWAQLCASWTLPFAWATTWRAMTDRRWLLPAGLTVVATIGFHFETGYLALASVVLMPLLVWTGLGSRLRNAGLLLLGSLVGSMWVTVPLLLNSRWAAVNSYLADTGLVRGYGARQDLTWLVRGQTFDSGRLPVVTVAVGIGLLLGLTIYRNCAGMRPAIGMFVLSLLLSFGPTSWNTLTDVIPGHADIFFRRFLMGVHLAGLYLAGLAIYLGATWVVSVAERLVERKGSASRPRQLDLARNLLALCLIGIVLIPAMVELGTYDRHNAADIGLQADAAGRAAPQLAPIVAFVRAHPEGRVFAGSPRTGGDLFTVGLVPVYELLADYDIDTVGFTMRTASLMSQPENFFDPTNPADYGIFGVRYLLLPTGVRPPVAAVRTRVSGDFTLWTVPGDSYFSLVESSGVLTQDRATIGRFSIRLLSSRLFGLRRDPLVSWASKDQGYHGVDWQGSPSPLGGVSAAMSSAVSGAFSATVQANRPAIVVLSSSFDPGWTAEVDGHLEPTVAMAPALVGVRVPAGVSRVRFVYVGFSGYPILAIGSLCGLTMLWLLGRRAKKVRRLDLPAQ